MRKIKKSAKIIISLACVLAVAIVGVVTAVLITNARRNRGKNPPSIPAYALTASQKELGSEIGGMISTAVSDKKLQPVKYSSSLASKLDVSKISYLDKNVVWSLINPSQSNFEYKAFVLDAEGNPSELLQFIEDEGLVVPGGTPQITFAAKNHFAVYYRYTASDATLCIFTVENGDVVLNKSFALTEDNYETYLGEDLFSIVFDSEFFVVLLKTNGVYYYEFFDYLSDYTNYQSFKIEAEDESDAIFLENGVFKVDGELVAARTEDGEFGLIDSVSNSTFTLSGGTIVETTVEHLTPVSGAELVDGKYLVYSYKLVIDGDEQDINLGSASKIVAVPYSGENFFGVFAQSVDVTGKLNETGTMIYFDYELNEIVKYPAKSASLSKIFYASDDSFITGDGIVQGKTSVKHNKTLDFESRGYEFVNILGNGDVVLKNKNGGMEIFDSKFKKIESVSFDEIVSRIDDENLIFVSGTKYYRYNITSRKYEKIDYVSTVLNKKTSVYFVKNEDGTRSLYSGLELIDDAVTEYSAGDNYLTFTSDSVEKKYYFVESTGSSQEVVFSASNTYGGSEWTIEPTFGIPAIEELLDFEPEWYEYDDKVVYILEPGGTGNIIFKATHCIQKGYYSKTDYVDYLEVYYNGQGSGANYAPYRVYYRVDINSNGEPEVNIISKGHHMMGYKEIIDEVDYNKTTCINVNGKMYEINDRFSLGEKAPPTNVANSDSYDYIQKVGGTPTPFYYYTDSTDAVTGLFFHDTSGYPANRQCKAEVYGNSIRVTLFFTFKSDGSHSIPFSTGLSFGKTMDIPNVDEEHYYNDLYYQTVVVGYLNEDTNYYTDIIKTPESGDNSIITKYFYDEFLSNPASNFDAKDRTNQQLFFSDALSSANMTACVSSKTYLSDVTVDPTTGALSYGYTKLYLGGKNFKTNIVGGQLVGISTINEANYNNINIKSLYSTATTSGTRSYFDERVEFRLIPIGASSATGQENADNIVKYTYLNYDATAGSENYSINIQNQDYIYYGGGLNSFRYIYCVFEPQLFYVDLDYNVSGDTASVGNEIDYLQSYASLNVGQFYKNDYVSYNKSWVYVNALETGSDEKKVFGTYDNAAGDKYYPHDFENTDSRAEPIDLLKARLEGKEDSYKKKYENSARIFEYKGLNQRYFYIIIDGVKYYFQNNFKAEEGNSTNYSKPYSDLFSGSVKNLFVVAYKNISDFEEARTDGYGKLSEIPSIGYYTPFFGKPDLDSLPEGTTGREGVYSSNVDFVNLRIEKSTAVTDTYVAYYYEENVHTRENIVYDGYYKFLDEIDPKTHERKIDTSSFNDAEGTKYSISETFSFLYTDNLIMTRLPQHTHYDFTGWKVIIAKNDGTNYEYIIDTTEIANSSSAYLNLNANLSSDHPFLPEYEGSPTGYKFYNFWRTIDPKGVISWNNLLSNPIKMVAQWQPKKCDVKAVLHIPTSTSSGTNYLGLRYDADSSTYGYKLTKNFNIADGATSAPVFKKGVDDIDVNRDGILDFSSETQFDYQLDKTFFDIGVLMANKSFSQNIINTTGLSCQFLGWSFLQTTAVSGSAEEYISIIPMLNNEPKDPRARDTKINEYIGDTTTITIYAYYATSRYNFFLRFHPMGGATLAEAGSDKSYYSQYDYKTGVSGNGNIFNAMRNPAVYDIEIKDIGTSTSSYLEKYTSRKSGHSVNTMGLTDNAYGIDYRDDNNPFFTGNGVSFSVTLNEQYYVKTIVISNLVLLDDSASTTLHPNGKLDMFTLTFTYEYTDEGGKWTGTCESQLFPSKTLTVKAGTSGRFHFGMNNGARNNHHNIVSIVQPTDDSTGEKTWTISIASLSNPGKMTKDNYLEQLLEGNDGFTLRLHPESYTIENESVSISTKDSEGDDTPGPFNNNNAMLVSSQPLTNDEGYEVTEGSRSFIWLGTSRYMFSDAWDQNIISGYYRMNPNGATVAVKVNYSYKEFMQQSIHLNSEIYVYYDATEARIYYPALYAGANERKVVAHREPVNPPPEGGGDILEQMGLEITAKAKRYFFDLDGVTYYINYNLDGAYDYVNFLGGYCLAHTSKFGEFGFDLTGEKYNDPKYHYKKGAKTIAVRVNMLVKKEETISYRILIDSSFSIGYNNTRVLAIDPDQENLYMSGKPSDSEVSDYFDLNYYLSAITIGTTTISFEKLTRNVINTPTVTAERFYGLLNLELMKNNEYISKGTLKHLKAIHDTNQGVVESGQDPDKTYVICYFGENYIIQDGYIIKINPISGRVGAETYYFYLTRNDKGFTRYFLIYDESTTKLSDLKLNYSIELVFKEFERNLEISVTENDLYDATNRSFEISYAEKEFKYTDGITENKYAFDYTIDYEDIIADSNRVVDKNKFYQFNNQHDIPFETIKNNPANLTTLRNLTTMSWKSSYDFTPAASRRLKISAKSGYIIQSLKVFVGTKDPTNPANDDFENVITFLYDESSLDYLYYYDIGKNYSFSSVEDNKLVSYISYIINRADEGQTPTEIQKTNIGYRVIANQTFGLFYSNFYDTNWGFADKETFSFDHLYLMLAGMYDDIKIEIETTSYSEFLFESGAENDGYNPLLNVDKFQSSLPTLNSNGSKFDVYYNIPIDLTYMYLYTMKYENDNDTELVLDKETLMNVPANPDDRIYSIRYYFDNGPNNVMRHTIRFIFFGTGSKIRYGLHFLATHEDYSVYFTNGRFYNEQMSSTGKTPFKELEAFSGRTVTNNAIVVNTADPKKDTRAKTNKLVYMFTGELHKEDDSANYTGYFVNTDYIVRNESSFKFFTAVTAFVNKVGVKTESYLYNHAMTIGIDEPQRNFFDKKSISTSRLDTSPSIVGNLLGNGDYNGVNFKYIHKNNGNELVIKNGSVYSQYQLDTLHKSQSWFNDTVLSNIQLYSYMDNPDVNSADYDPNVWVDRNEENESELTRLELGGLDFNWRYYEIPGYYLKYLTIKIADISSYFVVDIPNLSDLSKTILDNKLNLIAQIKLYDPKAVDGKSYNYKFNLYYYRYNKNGVSYSYYQLYPIFGEEKDDGSGNKVMVIDEFESVSLMSNDITIGFVSNAYSYDIEYNNYNLNSYVSTKNMCLDYATSGRYDEAQIIYYDSMTKLVRYQEMPGYTFIGWGSEEYYSSSAPNNKKSRFEPQSDKTTANIWNSTSIWYDVTNFFVQPKESAENNMLEYLKLADAYHINKSDKMPYGAFYTNEAYFMTDTGIKARGITAQNYNFFADYIYLFSKNISKSHTCPQNESNFEDNRVINLFAIWKVNTYAIEFDVNNSQYNDTVYIDYESKEFVYEFTEDKVGFRDKTKTGQNQEIRLCYVTFDTNYWYSLSGTGEILMYSAITSTPGGIPYSITPLVDGTVSKLAVDMFGYSWLGWYYTQKNHIEQGNIIDKSTRVFDSYYSSETNSGNNSLTTIPVFDKAFLEIVRGYKTVYELDFDPDTKDKANAQKFDYYGRHKESGSTLNPNTGYVCFYYYGHQSIDGNTEYASFGNASNTFSVATIDVPYIRTADYLNAFRTYDNVVFENGSPVTKSYIRYSGEYLSPILLSYYDTFMGENCYSVRSSGTRYALRLTSNAADLRRIKLFANWSQNKYQLVFNDLTSTGSSVFDWDLGSSSVESNVWNAFKYASGYTRKTVWFNNQDMAVYMLDKYPPTRIGYDFLGWSYNYIPLNTLNYQSLISTVNTPNQYSYLCKELLASYASMNGAVGTSDLESNVLMISGDRTSSVSGASWLLNASTGNATNTNAERLGDGEVDKARYVYVFPIWKAQTFSITISMNITAEQLKNMHEKDSNFAIGLYNSADPNCKTFTGVNSKYYTHNTTNISNSDSSKDPSSYYYYYNDMVANVCFEIEFDKPFSTATCSFAGKTYYLKDLMMTSAGYYFLGLMAQSEYSGSKEYVLKNLLRTTLEYSDGLVHHKDKANEEAVLTETGVYNNDSYLSYGEITGRSSSGTKLSGTDVFNLSAYYAMQNDKYYTSTSTLDTVLNQNDYEVDPEGNSMYSSNFGMISFSAYKYNSFETKTRMFNIMSEREGSEYYLFIIHNNVKYYVVYYNSPTTQTFEDVITSDRTFLYYNIKDAGGNVVNKYIIRFDSSGLPYYVDDSFINRHYLELYIALYTTKTNKLNLLNDGSSSTIIPYSQSNPSGSLTGGLRGVSIVGLISTFRFTLINKPTREFTLYADWEIRTLKTVIDNGNNTGATSDSNPGLEGFYQIKDKTSGGDSISSSSNADTFQKGVELRYDYYSDVANLFLPKFAGRYLSELVLEFDTLIEEGAGDAVIFSKRHNTIVFKFKWDNEKFVILIDSVTLNGMLVTASVGLKTETNYVLNTIGGIEILSMIDHNSLNNSTKGSGIALYNKEKGSAILTTSQEMDYTNKTIINLENIMSSMKFTCRYSIQTFLVEVYTVVADSEMTTNYYTPFSSETAMHLSSNYYPENRGLYGNPFISTESYATGSIPTISTDCAKLQTMSYNVPFYYFITDSSKVTNAKSAYNSVANDYGLNHIYGGNYTSGTSGTPVGKSYGDLKSRSDFIFVDWLTKPIQDGAVVTFSRYEQEAPITKNTRIYGYYFRDEEVPTKVLFYYWNNETNQYIQYTQNENDYDSIKGNCLVATSGGYRITKLPSPTIATWYGGGAKQFVGYVYLTDEIHTKFVAKTINEDYNSLKYQASNSFNETSGDMLSAYYMNRVTSIYGSQYHNEGIDSLYDKYVANISLPQMFSSRLTVHDGKYFTKLASVSGHSVKVLDGVRIAFSINEGVFYKDLKMLNVGTVLPAGKTVYAIPIYEDMNVSIKDIFVYKDEATITSNTNMIQSCVFETNSQYTVFYDPRDVKVAVASSSTLGVNNVKSNSSQILGLSTIAKDAVTYSFAPDESKIFDYNKATFTFSGTKYVYVFYEKFDGTPFFMSNAYRITSGQVRVQTKVEMYDSPINIKLSDANLDAYRVAYEAIEDDEDLSLQEKTNRKRVVYIMLQLMECMCLNHLNTTEVITYGSGGQWPDNASASQYSISECIRAINYYHQSTPIVDGSFVARQVYFDMFSIYRLAYSLAYEYTRSEKLNPGVGLKALYGTTNLPSQFYMYSQTYVTHVFDETKDNHLRPGDIMVSYRHDYSRTIHNVEGDEKLVYYYEPDESGSYISVNSSAEFAMYIGAKNDEIYLADRAYYQSAEEVYKTKNYQHLEEKDDGSIFQENDTYEKFTHELDSGYYTLNPTSVSNTVKLVDENGFFVFNNQKTGLYKYGGYYFDSTTFENSWKAYKEYVESTNKVRQEAYDTAHALWVDQKSDLQTAWSNWENYDRLYKQYQQDIEKWNNLTDDQKEGQTRPLPPTPIYTKPSQTVAQWLAANPEPTLERITEGESYYKDYVCGYITQDQVKKYNLTRYSIFSVGGKSDGQYMAQDDKPTSRQYGVFYPYQKDEQYYKLNSSTLERIKLSIIDKSYYTGYDNQNYSFAESWWLVCSALNTVYTRWASFFNSSTYLNGGIEFIDGSFTTGNDGVVMGGGSYPDGLPEDVGGIAPPSSGSGGGYTGAVLGTEVDPDTIASPLNNPLEGKYRQWFLETSKRCSDDIKRLTLVKIALQILQRGIIYQYAIHKYSEKFNGLSNKPNYCNNTNNKHRYCDISGCTNCYQYKKVDYNLSTTINILNAGKVFGYYREWNNNTDYGVIFTDCFGFVRLSHAAMGYFLSPDSPRSNTSVYEWGGSYEGSPHTSTSLSTLKVGTCIQDRLTGPGDRHVAMYLYTGDDGTVYYIDQGGLCTAKFKKGSDNKYTITDGNYRFNTYIDYVVG